MTNKDLTEFDQNYVDILALLFQMWKDKWYIVAITTSFFLISIYQLQNSTFRYDVTLKVTPSKQLSSTQSSSRFGGLASIIGISTPSTDSSDYFSMYKILINSRIMSERLSHEKKFIKNFSKSENLNIASELFDNGSIVSKDESWRSTIKSLFGLPTHSREVTLEDIIYTQILSKILISTDESTNITTIQLKSVDPDFGEELLKKLHHISDTTLKNRSLKKTDDYINFLNKQLSKTTKQDQRLSLITTLAEQQRSKMIASSDLSFAADYFGKPYHSNSPTTPRIRNVLLAFVVVGFFVGLFISILKYFFKISKF